MLTERIVGDKQEKAINTFRKMESSFEDREERIARCVQGVNAVNGKK